MNKWENNCDSLSFCSSCVCWCWRKCSRPARSWQRWCQTLERRQYWQSIPGAVGVVWQGWGGRWMYKECGRELGEGKFSMCHLQWLHDHCCTTLYLYYIWHCKFLHVREITVFLMTTSCVCCAYHAKGINCAHGSNSLIHSKEDHINVEHDGSHNDQNIQIRTGEFHYPGWDAWRGWWGGKKERGTWKRKKLCDWDG